MERQDRWVDDEKGSVTFAVDDADATAAKATELGGS
jgi:predicted enzyme related to lactoylglutathione lyase